MCQSRPIQVAKVTNPKNGLHLVVEAIDVYHEVIVGTQYLGLLDLYSDEFRHLPAWCRNRGLDCEVREVWYNLPEGW